MGMSLRPKDLNSGIKCVPLCIYYPEVNIFVTGCCLVDLMLLAIAASTPNFCCFMSRDRDDVKQWNGVGHFSPVNLYASNLHTHYTSHVPSSYGIYGSSYGSNLYRSSSYSSFRMPFSYRSRTGVYALYHRYY